MANRNSKSKKELKELSAKELHSKILSLEEHMFQLRLQWRTGQLANTAVMSTTRREIARAHTYLKQAEIKA